MHVQQLLAQLYERGIHDAASFLPLSIALIVAFAIFRLLIAAPAPRPPSKSKTATRSYQIQPPNSLTTLLKHGFSLQSLR